MVMLLRSITLSNFRAYEHAFMKFDGNGLHLIAGANNSGKSALLSAMQAMAGPLIIDDIRFAGSSRGALVTAVFELDEATRREILGLQNPLAESLITDGALSNIDLTFSENISGNGLALTRVRGSWPGDPHLELAFVGPPPDDLNALGVFTVDLQAHQHAHQPPLAAVVSKFSDANITVALDAQLANHRGFDILWKDFRKWGEAVYHFKALRPGAARLADLSSSEQLDPSGSNLHAFLLDLQSNRRDEFVQLQELIQKIVPGVGTLRAAPKGNQISLVFDDHERRERNIKELGTGVEQLLMTLGVGLTAPSPFTLLIEEPETNLHPAAQRALLGLLNEWSRDRLILAATHSPVMLDTSQGSAEVWLVERRQGKSLLRQLSSTASEAYQSLGVRLSDVLTADRVLILEGVSDTAILRTWFPEVFRDSRVAVVNGNGGDLAFHVDRFATWLSALGAIGIWKVLYVRDRDELSQSSIERLQRSGHVYVSSRREVENYLISASGLRDFFSNNGAEISEGEIHAALVAAAKDLTPLMILNRVVQDLPPIRLIDRAERWSLANSEDPLDSLLRSVASKVAVQEEIVESVKTKWSVAAETVDSFSESELLSYAPGDEILQAVFTEFLGRRYSKISDGPALAAFCPKPADLMQQLSEFLSL